MKSQRLRDARKKLDDIRQEMIRKIISVLPEASDQQLTRVALVFWPEPKAKPKPKSPEGKSGPKAKLRKIDTKAARKPGSSVTPASAKNAAEGRRQVATGLRPTLKEAMVLVMGNKTMNADAVVEALREKKWLPASSDHRQYLSFMLSNNCPETFERAERRGFYKVAKGVLQKAQANVKAREEAARADNLSEHWSINTDVSPDPFTEAGNGKKITTDAVWEAIKVMGLSNITAPKLAAHLKCGVNQLGSPLTKLWRDGTLIKEKGKKGVVYEVRQEGDGEPGS